MPEADQEEAEEPAPAVATEVGEPVVAAEVDKPPPAEAEADKPAPMEAKANEPALVEDNEHVAPQRPSLRLPRLL